MTTRDGDDASAVVFVDETISSALTAKPPVNTLTAKVTLKRVDGDWLMEDVELR